MGFLVPYLLEGEHTPWKVLVSTVNPVLVNRDIFFQKVTPAIAKCVEVILDDTSLCKVRNFFANKAFTCVAYTHRESQPVHHVAFYTNVFLEPNQKVLDNLREMFIFLPIIQSLSAEQSAFWLSFCPKSDLEEHASSSKTQKFVHVSLLDMSFYYLYS